MLSSSRMFTSLRRLFTIFKVKHSMALSRERAFVCRIARTRLEFERRQAPVVGNYSNNNHNLPLTLCNLGSVMTRLNQSQAL